MITGKVFGDLAIWMVGLGVTMGVVFPFVIIVLGLPAHATLRVVFFVGTVAAGLIVGGANFVLARRVVGGRLRLMADRMAYVGAMITEATDTGDWSRCKPGQCELSVDSADELGDAAASFNGLLNALDRSRRIEDAITDLGGALVQYLEVADVTAAALAGFIKHGGAQAGALGVVREGELVVEASHRLDGAVIEQSAAISNALRARAATAVRVPQDLIVDASLLHFRPQQVVVVPLTFKSVPVGVAVLAFAVEAPPDVIRLLDNLGNACGVAIVNCLSHERLQRLAAVDPLTGIYNRRFGDNRLDEEWARAVREHIPLGIISFDVDHFKAVNDTYGHLGGDRVLRETAEACRQALREGDVFVRTGGDEFLVILPGAGRQDVAAVAERVRRLVEAQGTPIAGTAVQVTLSVAGLSWPDVDAAGPDELLAKVDDALYQSKRHGRNAMTMVPASH